MATRTRPANLPLLVFALACAIMCGTNPAFMTWLDTKTATVLDIGMDW